MTYIISKSAAHAVGDIRAARTGDTIWLRAEWHTRPDAGRYTDALGVALRRGAKVAHG